jgi:hypothetical protein
MSISNRTSRRRRIAFGLGATGGGLLAAAFIPMGIALAAPVTTVGDPGLISGGDTETTPDPFSDFTGYPDVSNGTTLAEGNLDNQLNIDNSALAAQIDYDIDNKEPFSFSGLDGIPAEPTGYTGPDTPTTDLDPFEDAFLNNNGGLTTGALSTGETYADAQSYDYALNQTLTPDQVANLDAFADGTPGTTIVGTLPVPGPDNDPAVDFVQLFDANAVSPTTGLPNDIFGTFAVDYDKFLNAFGLGAPLDQLVDSFTGGLVNPTTEALGGLGSTTGDLLGGLTGTGADTLTGLGGTGADLFAGIDPLSFLGL